MLKVIFQMKFSLYDWLVTGHNTTTKTQLILVSLVLWNYDHVWYKVLTSCLFLGQETLQPSRFLTWTAVMARILLYCSICNSQLQQNGGQPCLPTSSVGHQSRVCQSLVWGTGEYLIIMIPAECASTSFGMVTLEDLHVARFYIIVLRYNLICS